MLTLDTRPQFLKGVGETRSRQLSKMGLTSVGALLRNFPLRHEDWSAIVPIDGAPVGEPIVLKATVSFAPLGAQAKGGITIYKTSVTDGTDVLNVTFFNNKYIPSQLIEGEEYVFYGKLTKNAYGRVEMLSPAFVKAESGERIRPVYRQSGAVTSKMLERYTAQALKELKGHIPETLPPEYLKRYKLPDLETALSDIHFPLNDAALVAAKRRLIFEELLVLQLGLLSLRGGNQTKNAPPVTGDAAAKFLSALPFEPTGAQRRCVAEAAADMAKNTPMNRLLSGDVGSGKTAVAAALIAAAAGNGFQCAFMAPTEVLAAQHYATLSRLFLNAPYSIELLTGSTPQKEKKRVKEALIDGSCQIAVGTHALIQSDVVFHRLGLVVTDEQHRFGVSQRAALGAKGESPHVLVMSATPIPRTLAMVIYGDLDVSVLDEMPKGRLPIKTYKVTSAYRNRIYTFIKKRLDLGEQAFVICPLVEESESGLVPATQYYEFLRDTHFKNYETGLLHGQMKPKDKDAVMARFASGELHMLVSTVVIEVGIDIPNATVMLIENAERFGLSQLHQLRGRIGRGQKESMCVLVSDAQNAEAAERFDILCKTTDGFAIADKDLQMRGPGDFFGSRQHGLPEMQIANLMTDTKALLEAGKAAREILDADPLLKDEKYKELYNEVQRLFTSL